MMELDQRPVAILTQPDLDEPRLRHAALLDEQCDPLGEFIRVQIRLSRVPAGDPHSFELERREQELLAEFEERWTADLVGRVDWWVFRRGFVQEVALSGAQFLEHAPVLFERFPIQEVHFQEIDGEFPALTASAHLGRPRHLDFSDNRLGDGRVARLAQSPRLANVRGLNLSSTGMGDAGAVALAQSPHLSSLQELYLCNNRIGIAGVRALAAAPWLPGIGKLFLDCNSIGAEDAQLLRRGFGNPQ